MSADGGINMLRREKSLVTWCGFGEATISPSGHYSSCRLEWTNKETASPSSPCVLEGKVKGQQTGGLGKVTDCQTDMFLQSFNQCKVLRSSPPAKLENTSWRKFDWVGLVIPSLSDVWLVHWLVIFTLCIFTENYLSFFLSFSLFLIHKQSREHTHTHWLKNTEGWTKQNGKTYLENRLRWKIISLLFSP